jgi:hypothetical protein
MWVANKKERRRNEEEDENDLRSANPKIPVTKLSQNPIRKAEIDGID